MPSMTLEQLEELTGSHAKRSASDVKSQWRSIVDQANDVGEVIVTNYNRPEAVVVSVDQYTKLKEQAAANDPLARIRADLDRKLAWLREPGAADELDAIFNSTPEEIAEAANALAARETLAKRES
jgi:prevent-host-death family protein